VRENVGQCVQNTPDPGRDMRGHPAIRLKAYPEFRSGRRGKSKAWRRLSTGRLSIDACLCEVFNIFVAGPDNGTLAIERCQELLPKQEKAMTKNGAWILQIIAFAIVLFVLFLASIYFLPS